MIIIRTNHTPFLLEMMQSEELRQKSSAGIDGLNACVRMLTKFKSNRLCHFEMSEKDTCIFFTY